MTIIYRVFGKTLVRLSCALCALVTLGSCAKGGHIDGSGLAAALRWADKDDEKTMVSDARLWVFGPEDGRQAAALHFGSAGEVAATFVPVTAGRYTVVAACNLVPPFSAAQGSSDANAAADESLSFSLSPADAGPAHSFYGVTEVLIDGKGGVEVADVALRRVMSELSITIEDAPAGVVLSGEVLDAAKSLFPGRKDVDGSYGVTGDEAEAVSIPRTVAASSGLMSSPVIRLMPTAAGREYSHLRLLLSAASGDEFEFRIEAPLMKPAGKYVVTLKYGEMRPYMRLSVHSINDWTEGWIYNGEILDPDSASVLAQATVPVRTKSIPCVKSGPVRTGTEENNCCAHEGGWCAQNSPRAHGGRRVSPAPRQTRQISKTK